MSTTQFGHRIVEHTLRVPWDYSSHNGAGTPETFELFAREVIPPDGEDFPAIVWFQGGPGFPSPRPLSATGLFGEALKHYRWILLDQRGTGRSHRIDSASPAHDLTAQRLGQLRQENIVRDAEELRTHLNIDNDDGSILLVLLQSWARVEKPNLKTLVVLAPGCLSCLEYPADDHRVRVRVPVGKHRALAFP